MGRVILHIRARKAASNGRANKGSAGTNRPETILEEIERQWVTGQLGAQVVVHGIVWHGNVATVTLGRVALPAPGTHWCIAASRHGSGELLECKHEVAHSLSRVAERALPRASWAKTGTGTEDTSGNVG